MTLWQGLSWALGTLKEVTRIPTLKDSAQWRRHKLLMTVSDIHYSRGTQQITGKCLKFYSSHSNPIQLLSIQLSSYRQSQTRTSWRAGTICLLHFWMPSAPSQSQALPSQSPFKIMAIQNHLKYKHQEVFNKAWCIISKEYYCKRILIV